MLTVSKLGSAPLFARKNLPSLDDVPCSSLARVTAVSAIFAATIALLPILAWVIWASAISLVVIDKSAILADVTAPVANLAEVTASSLIPSVPVFVNATYPP